MLEFIVFLVYIATLILYRETFMPPKDLMKEIFNTENAYNQEIVFGTKDVYQKKFEAYLNAKRQIEDIRYSLKKEQEGIIPKLYTFQIEVATRILIYNEEVDIEKEIATMINTYETNKRLTEVLDV